MGAHDDQEQPPSRGPAASRGSDSGKGSQHLEGLNVKLMTAFGGLAVVVTVSISIGLWVSKVSSLESRLDLAERTNAAGRDTIMALKQDQAIMETKAQRAAETQLDFRKQLDRMEKDFGSIQEVVIVLCNTSRERGGLQPCRVRGQ